VIHEIAIKPEFTQCQAELVEAVKKYFGANSVAERNGQSPL
jgi:hypothetical protein